MQTACNISEHEQKQKVENVDQYISDDITSVINNNANSWLKPMCITNELSSFFQNECRSYFTKISSARCSFEIINYINKNNLRDENNMINLDIHLCKLLHVKDNKKMTFVEIHNLLSYHLFEIIKNDNEYDQIKWENGDEYQGEWKNGKMHGIGKYTQKDGTSYEGKWKYGKIKKRKSINLYLSK